jgi:zinc transporter ZupT
MFLPTLLALLTFISVHLFVGRIDLATIPRSRWLSLAGGISVTYIFLHVLPEFAEYQVVFRDEGALGWLEHHVYSFALLGLVAFYALERAAKRSSQSDREPHNDRPEEPDSIFWVHILSFSVYNFIIGYLLPRGESQGGLELLYYTVAMTFHFVVNDYSLHDHYQKLYRHRGRYIVTAALAVGWGVGLLAELPEIYLAAIFSFVAGGVIMNVLKEELPEERRSSLSAFVGGVAIYAVLLALT